MIDSYNPQNPYQSYLVSASAGSGKTYQLSRRYLFLVGAGALPQHILTITFTKQAAAEMRSRIIKLAAELCQSDRFANEYESTLRQFASQSGLDPSHLLKPFEVGQRILRSSQRLKISTMDSVFHDWLQRFPYEVQQTFHTCSFPTNFELLGDYEFKQLSQDVWQLLGPKKLAPLLAHADSSFLERFQGLNKIKPRLEELAKHETYLWLCQRLQQREHAINNYHEPECSQNPNTDFSFWEKTAEAWQKIASDLNSDLADSVRQALSDQCFSSLYASGILSQKHLVSGRYIRGKKREKLEYECQVIEAALASK